MATDQELVDRVIGGDDDAFAFLAQRYERSVLAVIQAEVRDPLLAQDIAVQAFRRAYRGLANLTDGSLFGPWLIKIARRQTINVLRTMPIPVGSSGSIDDSECEFESDDPEWIENERVLGLLIRLPAEERRLIGLHYFDNHSLMDIAEVTGRPVHVVRRQVQRAVSRLKYRWEWEQEL